MKRVLITGGSRGIGRSIAEELFAQKYHVIVNYCHTSPGTLIFQESIIPTYGFDVSDPIACQENVELIEKEHGPIDVLVLNAGITRDSLLHKMTLDMWNQVIQTNLSSCFYLTRAVIKGMYERKYGRIVLLSSINAAKGQRGQTNYCAAKAGLLGFMKALAQESIGYGVTVNAIAPGYTNTDMVQAIPKPILEKIIDTIPLKRLADPEEIARCVAFLVAEEAQYITGHTLHVNGGMYFS